MLWMAAESKSALQESLLLGGQLPSRHGRWQESSRALRYGAAAATSLLLVALMVPGILSNARCGWSAREGDARPSVFTAEVLREQTAEAECIVNIFLVRHCDKNPPWSKDPTPKTICKAEGLFRGQNLARVFGPGGSFPVPRRLYARQLAEGKFANRDLFLLWPLAQRLGVMVNTSFSEDDMLGLAEALLAEKEAMCDAEPKRREHSVLVSWKHCSIPALAQALGCHADRCTTCWDDGDFETVLWLKYTTLARSGAWNLSFQLGSEEFHPPTRVEGYRECYGSSVESSNFGLPCKPPISWMTGGFPPRPNESFN
ncbi:unnamed protein product [Polarella glacialis]|uniref:Uncharacterized protein n=2 Tax=Polarella glacialis TaxID=89957 RepID=A0A813M0C9_POLGL|nr:unnamed protein product [Polarella glacialis]CAE8743912.1 unnamed protein product [Polarella glacialis]